MSGSHSFASAISLSRVAHVSMTNVADPSNLFVPRFWNGPHSPGINCFAKCGFMIMLGVQSVWFGLRSRAAERVSRYVSAPMCVGGRQTTQRECTAGLQG